jgi:hypothetical protein
MRRIFWGYCINRFDIGPLHYVSSCSDFGFEFAEIFTIEKRNREEGWDNIWNAIEWELVQNSKISVCGETPADLSELG